MDIIHTKEAFLEGQLLRIDKPFRWTSFQVVNKIRWAIRKEFDIKKIKVGHAGTLDPLATGLMLICTGRMTKQIEQFMGMPKTYTGSFRLGATTPSYDLETSVSEPKPTGRISAKMLEEVRAGFLGNIQQKPPIYAAIKKDGKRLYSLARAGKTIEIPSRKVQVTDFKLIDIKIPDVHFSVSCSKGTYIRSLAHDFGQKLGCGAHLTSLKRTAVGSYPLSAASTLDAFLHSLEAKS